MSQAINDMMQTVESLDREGCITQLRRIRRPKLDFTEEYLQGQSLDKLRHIVMAAFLHAFKSSC